ncbi:glycoside hydrolase family 5 protein, partial [Staphylococcus epidermidis]|uniref:glycoside hydrolase family 5 protein n=1 Tax=Staphylococcus epidermidis TaxID=1282 RepID=UPI00287B2BDA
KKVADAQGKTKEILHNIAKHYKDEDAIAGYDVLNEPKGQSKASKKAKPDSQVNQFYKDAVKSIRDSGDKHIIFLEGIWDPDNLKNPSYYNDTAHNLVYEYHNYATKWNDSVKQSFDDKLDKIQTKDYNVPSYMGEFSTRAMGGGPKAQKGDLDYILKQMNNKHLSWSLWNYDTQLDNNKGWSPIHYSGLKVDGDNIGEKENVTRDDAVYDTLKNNS